MLYQITAKFFFDNGQVKKVDWLEPELKKRDSEEYLTKDEVEKHFRAMFLKYIEDGKALSLPNIMGKVSFIPFSKLYYMELEVKVVDGKEVIEDA